MFTTYKSAGAHICLFAIWGQPQPIAVTRQRNTHFGEYIIPVSVHEGIHPRCTLRTCIYHTSVAITLHCSRLRFGKWLFQNSQKQSVSNAFLLCSASPCYSAYHDDFREHLGQMATAKLQIFFGKRLFYINFLSGKNKNCVNSLAMRRVLIIFASDFINVIH